jgi:diguanylate cyclase (GGDEF)-like protein
MLVYGVMLVVVGVTATAQATMVSASAWTSTLNATVAADSTIVRAFVSLNLRDSDVSEGGIDPARRAALEQQLAVLTSRDGVVRVEIRAPNGYLVASDAPGLSGQTAPLSPAFARTVTSQQVDAGVVQASASEMVGPVTSGFPSLLREYLPIIADGRVYAVFGLWRDAGPILASLDASRWTVVLVTLTGAAIVALLLFFIFRSAQSRISRQTVALIESNRRDSLTGALNHGAVVAALAELLESVPPGGTLEVGLIDIDNFRNLNDTYGQEAGDQVLLDVHRLLEDILVPAAVLGRYGPDEFLVVSKAEAAGSLGPAVERFRAALAEVSLRVGASEPLPVTVSAGICSAPRDAGSVTELLSIAGLLLGEAKASGGNAVRASGPHGGDVTQRRAFDVLQGLVIAIDTKDHYTRRHSEDVARYADFLAERLDLDTDLRRSLHLAGLLHDVGKIGILDAILRKPGKLTNGEYDIVKQHVALGDMVVRDLPGLEVVRAGIRHHHERWDGQGYLDGLAAEDLPLIARVLAVADAFSAMTTTRPYRKALSVEQALTRLEDAAGTQLDERLVVAFVDGIRSAADPPQPGAVVASWPSIWMPDQQVA